MAELRNRQWLLAARPKGLIKESDFKWNETTTRVLKDGELLSRNLALSFDPTQREWMSYDTYMKAIPLGETMKAGTVGQVVESKRDGFAKGDLVQGLFGWEDYTITNGEGAGVCRSFPPERILCSRYRCSARPDSPPTSDSSNAVSRKRVKPSSYQALQAQPARSWA